MINMLKKDRFKYYMFAYIMLLTTNMQLVHNVRNTQNRMLTIIVYVYILFFSSMSALYFFNIFDLRIKISIKWFFYLLVLSFLSLFTFFLFPLNIIYMINSLSVNVLFRIIIGSYIIFNERLDIKILMKYLYYFSIFPIIYFTLFSHNVPSNIMNYMDLGIAIVPPLMFTLSYGFIYKSKIIFNITLSISLFFSIFINRGLVLTLFIYILLILVLFYFKKIKQRIYFLIIGVISMLVISNIDLIQRLSSLLAVWGMESRNLTLITNDMLSDSSGRDTIYLILKNELINRPIFGYGLFGDRLILNRFLGKPTYSHNIILELIVSFGFLGGIIIIVTFTSLIISTGYKIWKNGLEEEKMFFLCMTTISVIPLFFSSSFLLWPFFSLYLPYIIKGVNYEKNLYSDSSFSSRN